MEYLLPFVIALGSGGLAAIASIEGAKFICDTITKAYASIVEQRYCRLPPIYDREIDPAQRIHAQATIDDYLSTQKEERTLH